MKNDTHSKLQVGALIFMQKQNTKRWNWPGRVEQIRPGGASYYIRGTARSDGRLYLRARHFLKEVKGKALRDEYVREANQGSNDVTIPFFQTSEKKGATSSTHQTIASSTGNFG